MQLLFYEVLRTSQNRFCRKKKENISNCICDTAHLQNMHIFLVITFGQSIQHQNILKRDFFFG